MKLGNAGKRSQLVSREDIKAGWPVDCSLCVQPVLTGGVQAHFQNHKDNAGSHCHSNSLFRDGIVQ